MKELIISVIVIAMVCVGSFYMQQYLEQTSNEIIERLELLKQEMKQVKEGKEDTRAVELSEEVLQMWEKIDKNWSMIVVHEELDNIELSILGVKAAIEAESFDDGLQEIEKSIFLVGHIHEKEAFKLTNIF